MPRANRCILPGEIYHLTHRCHNKRFLFRFGLDRTEYCKRLRASVRLHRISLLDYCVTCNHTHLLVSSNAPRDLSLMMQQLEGEFAAYYNRRKNQSGSFWGDRFHCTMVENGTHLWNCLRYIDLNMVRAGAVSYPGEWSWCGYQELMGLRERFCLLDMGRLLELLDTPDLAAFRETHAARIDSAIRERQLSRESHWTEAVAVGSKSYVRSVAERLRRRKRLRVLLAPQDAWYVREDAVEYGRTEAQLSVPDLLPLAQGSDLGLW